MIYPTVHLNGTSREELLRQLEEAGRALVTAITAFEDAEPNGRDYYPQGERVIYQVQKEYRERLLKLQQVSKDISELYEHVVDQNDNRGKNG